MQFQVPQFIEVEDKIFGPLTFKQFVYVAGGGGIAFVIWQVLPTIIAILLIVPIVGLALALAFYKINGKPFIEIMESAIKYSFGGKLYIWKKNQKKPTQKSASAKTAIEQVTVPRLSDSKLKDIAWSLGVKDSMYSQEAQNKKPDTIR